MSQQEQSVRLRFAPSPTGYLHVGGARTAIYNYLYRQRVGGRLVLRIEDTDRARSDDSMTRQIQDALRWLGVEWDEGPFLQSNHGNRHRERAQELLDSGHAYACYLTPEELEEARKKVLAGGESALYDTHRFLDPAELDTRIAEDRPHVVRFRMPRENTVFEDLIRGDLDIPPDAQDDFILLRSDGTPTYHLSVVCDDIDMKITHVVRGEDHLSNTPKHIRLFAALGAEPPIFGHLPLMLGTDKKRLSKRSGATSVEEFRDQGILPEALFNYLALLSWSPGDDRELMSRREMCELFDLGRVGASAATFDVDKLTWTNAQYLSSLPVRDVLHHLHPFLDGAGLAGVDEQRLEQAVDLHRTRPKTLKDLAESVRPYFVEQLEYDDELCAKFIEEPQTIGLLGSLKGKLAQLDDFSEAGTEAALRELADERGVKAGALIHPTRMALTAAKAGPGLFEIVEVMGQPATIRHLNQFMAYLRSKVNERS